MKKEITRSVVSGYLMLLVLLVILLAIIFCFINEIKADR